MELVDDFEVSLFLRETRTRHSLLTRQKTVEDPDRETTANENDDSNTAETGILVESDDDDDKDLHDIPAADESSTAASASASASVAPSERRKKKPTQDEKKLRFRTSYESFNIHGWVLCLLVSRKAVSAEPKGQVLMEEWMSTQAQAQGMDE